MTRLLPAAMLAGVCLHGCGSGTPLTIDERPPVGAAPERISSGPAPAPPPAAGPASGDPRLATARAADVAGLSPSQLDTMFDAAVAQARPFAGKAAICVGMQGLGDRVALDAPAPTIARLSAMLRLPAVPASRCASGPEPYVIGSGAKAMLYTVRVEARNVRGTLTFLAMAVYGNLGATGTQSRLVRLGGRWVPVPTGLSILS